MLPERLKRSMRRVFWGLLFCLALSAELAAQPLGWHSIRGPEHDGHSSETDLADSWPAEGPPVLWTRNLGQGYSAFVAWGDRIATQYQTLGGQYVVCMSAETGETVWQYRYGWPYEAVGVYPGPRATPTYHAGRLIFAAPDGLVGCLDADSGRLIWSVNVLEQFEGQGTGFGYSCSPTVVDEKVILPVGGPGASLVAFNLRDGEVVWRAGDEPASYTPAYPIELRGRRLVIGYLQNALVCHDRESGELLWRRELSAGYDEHSNWPIYSEPYLWIGSAFRGGSELLELSAEGEPPRTVWKSDLMSNDICSSVLIDGAIYGFDITELQAKVHRPTRGQFRCIDFLTGQELWSAGSAKLRRSSETKEADVGRRVGQATVLYADGKLILLNDTGELILAKATKSGYEELARTTVLGGEICWTQPALLQGRLFVRNQSRAVCLYLGDPARLAQDVKERALTTADIPQSRYVDVAGLLLGVEPEAAFDIPDEEWLWQWFWISLGGVLGISGVVALLVHWLLAERLGRSLFWLVLWPTSFLLGAVGTTLASRWTGDFVFTWHTCLFVAFQTLVSQMALGRRGVRASAWRSRLIALGFLAVCVGYFLLCRRLSLVFEWVFLCGFGPALPFSVAGMLMFREKKWRPLWQVLMVVAAFTSFHWGSAALLWLKG